MKVMESLQNKEGIKGNGVVRDDLKGTRISEL